MNGYIGAAAFVVALPALLAAQGAPPPDLQALQRMASTERAFAASAAEIGVRDAFLTFFADDAVSLAAGADGAHATLARARDHLRALAPPTLPILTRLMWEPFTGHVSVDGTMGWLTGGYVNLNLVSNEVVAHGAYFSVWKRQPDGLWRVWLDQGVSLPSIWQDASPFRVAPDPAPITDGTPDETLEAVEASVADAGAGWRARLDRDVRLHRDGRMPLVGRDAVLAWAGAAWSSVRYVPIRIEVAGSGDLGVALGGYGAASEHGTWVRVWKRDVTGRWQIVFETSTPAR